ncbi:MAG: GIY-YIG nuclease family protein [Acidobacteria bacterium]|nr:GIY-YIG nuclease family protein [Acidobacteriota bacterium]
MQERRPCVYIVSSRSRNLYIGVTSDLQRRIWQHRNKIFEGFTSDYECHRLVWRQYFETMDEAIAREKQLKRWSRPKKIVLIERNNPTWEDLSAEWGKPVEFYQWPEEA